MTSRPSLRLFDFHRIASKPEGWAEAIRSFANCDPYRSAKVEELVLDEDFYRRPLRPEDLSFIKFDEPVKPQDITCLPSLATQRLLLSINELDMIQPQLRREGSFGRAQAFYDPITKAMGARIRPFLESFVFDHLEPEGAAAADRATQLQMLRNGLNVDVAFWIDLFAHLKRADFLEEGLRFVLLQKWCLAANKRFAFAKAKAAGFFNLSGGEHDAPRASHGDLDDLVRRLAQRCSVLKREHSYWQFYLSSSLASCNLLHAMAANPGRALAFVGAAFAAEAEWLAFGCLVGKAVMHFGLDQTTTQNLPQLLFEDLNQRFERTLNQVLAQLGDEGVREIGRGLAAAQRLSAYGRSDLNGQIQWLSAVDRYRDVALVINRRIQSDYPDIDRETFVEPREMCSTTHVHDDHRLVVIETGNMVFWGNLGMTLRLAPGEMVLVPRGRLHGSSIESDECVYHQPIIPESWIEPLVADLAISARAVA